MSFGFSPSDIVTLITLCSKAYSGWKNGLAEYTEITDTLDSLLVLLRRIDVHFARNPNGGGVHAQDIHRIRRAAEREDLNRVLGDCDSVVSELYSIVKRYRSLKTNRRSAWKRFRLGTKDLVGLRMKLTRRISSLSAFLLTVELDSIDRVEQDVHNLPEKILQGLPLALGNLIDARMADNRSTRGSIMTAYTDDDTQIWKQFCRELRRNGVRSRHIQQHNGELRQFFMSVTGSTDDGMQVIDESQEDEDDDRGSQEEIDANSISASASEIDEVATSHGGQSAAIPRETMDEALSEARRTDEPNAEDGYSSTEEVGGFASAMRSFGDRNMIPLKNLRAKGKAPVTEIMINSVEPNASRRAVPKLPVESGSTNTKAKQSKPVAFIIHPNHPSRASSSDRGSGSEVQSPPGSPESSEDDYSDRSNSADDNAGERATYGNNDTQSTDSILPSGPVASKISEAEYRRRVRRSIEKSIKYERAHSPASRVATDGSDNGEEHGRFADLVGRVPQFEDKGPNNKRDPVPRDSNPQNDSSPDEYSSDSDDGISSDTRSKHSWRPTSVAIEPLPEWFKPPPISNWLCPDYEKTGIPFTIHSTFKQWWSSRYWEKFEDSDPGFEAEYRVPIHGARIPVSGRKGFIWTYSVPVPMAMKRLPARFQRCAERMLEVHDTEQKRKARKAAQDAKGEEVDYLDAQHKRPESHIHDSKQDCCEFYFKYEERILLLEYKPLEIDHDKGLTMQLALPPGWTMIMATKRDPITFLYRLSETTSIRSSLPPIPEKWAPSTLPEGWVKRTNPQGIIWWGHKTSGLRIAEHPATHPLIELDTRRGDYVWLYYPGERFDHRILYPINGVKGDLLASFTLDERKIVPVQMTFEAFWADAGEVVSGGFCLCDRWRCMCWSEPGDEFYNPKVNGEWPMPVVQLNWPECEEQNPGLLERLRRWSSDNAAQWDRLVISNKLLIPNYVCSDGYVHCVD